jgi:putative transposase
MTAPSSIDPTRFLHEQLGAASPDLLRSMLTTFINTLMSAEADAVCGAGYGQPSPDRVNVRNGYRHREFDTRAGTLDVAIPKLREGSYFPDWLLERRRRAERALTTVVAQWSRPATCSGSPRGGWRSSSRHSGSPGCPSRRSA